MHSPSTARLLRRPLLALSTLVLLTLACYSISLSVQVEDEGSGLMTLILRYYAGDHGDQVDDLVGQLTAAGWRVSGPPEVSGDMGSLVAQYEFGPNTDLTAQLRAIPGFEETSSRMSLTTEEAEGLEHRRFTFDSALDMSRHQAFWAQAKEVAANGMEVDCEDTPLDWDESDDDCTLEITPEEAQEIIRSTGPISFRLQVSLPGTVEETPGAWTDYERVLVDWSSNGGATRLPLKAVSVLQPDRELEDPDQLNDNLDRLLDRFETEIPAGQVVTSPTAMQNYLAGAFDFLGNGPGTANNMTGGGYACGDYQGIVTNWLDSVRLSQDPGQRALLDGWEYGPVQAYFGGHQAVVLYPKGSDWQQEGIILDPWPTQIPTFFTFEEWDEKFWGIGPGEGHQDYPHMTGGDPHYPDSRTQASRLHFRRISVNSPVQALAVRADGARLGFLPDGTFINEIPGADFYSNPMPDGTSQTYFGLPEGDFQLELTGTDEGQVHILVGDGTGDLVTYGSQPIERDGLMTFELDPQDEFASDLTLPDGSQVGHQPATVERLEKMFGPTAAEPVEGQAQTEPQSEAGPRLWLILAALCLLGLCGLAAVGLAGGGLWLAQRRKRSSSQNQ
jgi:hypothetical protein